MWGMFTSSGVPLKPYYAFLAFRRMLDTPKRISVAVDGDTAMAGLAGMSDDRKMLRVLISNTSPQSAKLDLQFKSLPWSSRSAYEVYVVDQKSDLTAVGPGARMEGSNPSIDLEVGGSSVYLLTLRPAT